MSNVKKLLFVFLSVAMIALPFTSVSAKTAKKTEKTTTTTTTTVAVDPNAVTVSVFYRTTCPHCQELHAFLKELKESKDYGKKFNVVDYEVVTSEESAALMAKVGDYFDFQVDGVPFYVIGTKYYSGFGDASKDEIKKQIDALYGNAEENIDLVAGISNGTITGKFDGNSGKSVNNTIGMIILGVSVVIVIVLIVLSSKNKYDDEEEIEVKKEVVELIKEEKNEKNAKNTKKSSKK